MQIKVIQPTEKYQDFIRKITIFRTTKKIIQQQKITPSPFTCLSYNHFDIPDFKVENKIIKLKNRLQITGPNTRDDIIVLHKGNLYQVLIELSPSAFYYFFRKSPADIENQIVPITKLVNKIRIDKLLQSLLENNNYKSLIKKLTKFLEELKALSLPPVDYIENAISLIDESRGIITVNSVCEQINKSDRQFNRQFREIIGIPPIKYIKIRQLHFIINRIYRNHFDTIKELAYDTGFYDPAHFTNSFKRLTGMSPELFIKSDEHIALDYFSELI